uniref:Uncharacterized protein n=1 Tax=Nelumbo nucifera TaxID=4432 RepID=A0A822XLL6_NELNU|nr:TPA_asm: hypothetical protein HUJ06_021412 [Nelumbo nucifera]
MNNPSSSGISGLFFLLWTETEQRPIGGAAVTSQRLHPHSSSRNLTREKSSELLFIHIFLSTAANQSGATETATAAATSSSGGSFLASIDHPPSFSPFSSLSIPFRIHFLPLNGCWTPSPTKIEQQQWPLS